MQSISHLWEADLRGNIRSEDDFLRLVDAYFPRYSRHFPQGRGHDCAELENLPASLALSTDMFLEGSHFSRAYFTPAEAAAKALTAAVSDLAASGARPLGFSLGIAMPGGMPVRTAEEIVRGMAEKAEEYGIGLTGGDVARSRELGFSLCVWGEGAGHGFLRRGGALPGDRVFLVGSVGLARAGLFFLEACGREAMGQWPLCAAAHLAPRALVEEGRRIAAFCHAMKACDAEGGGRISLMDLSDGLARDLPRLLGSAGMELDITALRLPEELEKASAVMGMPAEDISLAGGEDYALLGSCPEEFMQRLEAAVPGLCFIGEVTERPGIARKGGGSLPQGFDHFAQDSALQEGASQASSRPDCGQDRFFPQPLRRMAQPISVSQKVAEAAHSLIRLGESAYRAGLMAGFNGNISYRVDLGEHAGNCCLITRSGSAKGCLELRDLILLSLEDGRPIEGFLPESPSGPSSESPLHFALYAACPNSRLILHAHPPKLLALSLSVEESRLLNLPLPEAERYRAALAVVPFFPPGGEALAYAVSEAAKGCPAVWMQRHGLVVHSEDAATVLGLSEELEQLAGIQLASLSAEARQAGAH